MTYKAIKKLISVVFTAVAIPVLIWYASNHRIYRSFEGEYGLYKYFKNGRVSIYYKSDFKREFLEAFTFYTLGGINIYESLNDSAKGRSYYVAEVKNTCGSGCGKIGLPGIEIQSDKLRKIYRGFTRTKKFDSLIFYELGRNFWLYDDQLTSSEFGLSNAMRTGFAVFMRNICIDKLKIDADSVNNLPYDDYLVDLKEIFYRYAEDSALSITDVLIYGKLPERSSDLEVTASNFWASLLFFLYEQKGFGDDWLNRIWREISKRPIAENETAILNYFYSACTSATERDLTGLFGDKLKWSK